MLGHFLLSTSLCSLLSKTGADYSDYQFVEMWVNDGAPVEQSSGTFHIDLGTVSEDFYPLMAPNGIWKIA